MIKFLKSLFRRANMSPYERGYQMALDEMDACQPYEVKERLAYLYNLAEGSFNTTNDENMFDLGVRVGLSNWEKRHEPDPATD